MGLSDFHYRAGCARYERELRWRPATKPWYTTGEGNRWQTGRQRRARAHLLHQHTGPSAARAGTVAAGEHTVPRCNAHVNAAGANVPVTGRAKGGRHVDGKQGRERIVALLHSVVFREASAIAGR